MTSRPLAAMPCQPSRWWRCLASPAVGGAARRWRSHNGARGSLTAPPLPGRVEPFSVSRWRHPIQPASGWPWWTDVQPTASPQPAVGGHPGSQPSQNHEKPSLSPTLAPRLAPALERVDQQQPLAPDAEQQQPLAPDASLRHDLETFMAKYGGRPAATSKLGIRVARAGNAVDNLLEGYPTLSSPTEKRASKFLAALSKGQSLTPFNDWSKYMRLRVNLKKSSLP